MKIIGMKQIQAALKQLPVEMQKAAEVAALRGGGKVISSRARAFAPVGDGKDAGDLKKSIAFNVKKHKGEITARIGPRTKSSRVVGTYSRGKKKGQPKRKNPQAYSHLVEYGTSHSAARPFLATAADSSKSEVVAAMMNSYQKHLVRVAKKAAKWKTR